MSYNVNLSHQSKSNGILAQVKLLVNLKIFLEEEMKEKICPGFDKKMD